MPARPLQLCRQHGCRTLTRDRGGRCEVHQRQQTREGNDRGSADRRASQAFIKGKRWRALRLIVLAANPLCVQCKQDGYLTPATEVDHIIPRDQRPDLAYDQSNLQPLCRSCHSRKTMTETNEVRGAASIPGADA